CLHVTCIEPGVSRAIHLLARRPPAVCSRVTAGSLRIPVDDNPPPAPPASGRRVSGSLRSAIEWTLIVVGALVVALIVKATVLQAFYIPSESMTPTLKVGDRVLVNKLSYHVHAVHRGDVVVFKRPPKEEDPNVRDLIKRVIGLPRETIETRDGIVYIDGRRLDEPYVHGEVTENLPKQVVTPG